MNNIVDFIKKIPVWCYLAFCLLISLPSLFQGLGQDSCLYINGFKDFLNYPASCMFDMQWYLFFVIGSFLGIDTIIEAKIAGGIILLVLWILGYIGLRKEMDKTPLCVGLTMAFIGVYGAPIEMSYNHISILLLLPASILIMKSLDNTLLALFSGILIGINFFVRFTNLSLFAIGFIPLVVCFFRRGKTSITYLKAVQILGFYLLGCILSCFVIYRLMLQSGHWDLFMTSVFGSLQVSQNATGTEGKSMIEVLMHALKCYITPLLLGIIYLGILYIVAYRTKLLYNKVFFILIGVSSTIFFYFISRSALMIYAMFLLPILILAWIKLKLSARIHVLILLSLVMLYFYPVGSSSVMSFSGPFTFWLALPLALMCVQKLLLNGTDEIRKLCMYVCLSIFSAIMIKNITFQTYSLYKGQNRFASIYSLSSKNFCCQFTKKEKANELNHFFDEFKPFINDDTPLVVHNSVIHANLNTRSFGVSEGWIKSNLYELYLSYALAEQKEYPWILGNEEFYAKIMKCLKNAPSYEIVKEYKGMKLYKPINREKNETFNSISNL